MTRARWGRMGLALLVGLFGVAGGTIAYRSVKGMEHQRALDQLDRRLARTSLAFERMILSNAEQLYALHFLFGSRREISREEFHALAHEALARNPMIQALEYAPRVLEGERGAHENEMRAQGMAGYRITERRRQGEMAPAGRRDEYYPVCYLEPLAGNELALGFDLASNRIRRAALARAARSGSLALSDPVVLVQEAGVSKGLLALVPVYRGDPRTEEARRAGLMGFVAGVFRIERMIRALADQDRRRGLPPILMELVDESGEEGEPVVVYASEEWPEAAIADLGVREKTIEVGGQRFRLAARPSREYLAAHRTRLPIAAGVGSSLIAILLVCLVLVAIREGRDRARRTKAHILRSTLRSLRDGVIVADGEGRLLHVNEAAAGIIGIQAGPVPPVDWSARYGCFLPDGRTPYPPEDLPLARAIKGEEIVDSEVFVRNHSVPQGVWLSVSGSPLLDEKGRRAGGVVVLRDISGKRRAREHQQRLLNAVEQTDDTVFITDRAGSIEYVNPAFETTTGYSLEEAVGQTPRLLKSGFHDKEYYEKLWAILLKGDVFRGMTINRRKDGKIYYAEQTITPMRTAAGETTHFVSVCKDMTDRRKVEEQEIEMRLAASVQERLYPRRPVEAHGLDVAGAVYPAKVTCGDYYDYIDLPGRSLGIAIGDVCGHGLGPALLMAETRAYLRALSKEPLALGEIFGGIHRALAPGLLDSQYVTLMVARLDLSGGSLRYLNAGHPSGYVIGRRGEVASVLESTSMPLGFQVEGRFGCDTEVPFGSEDLLVLFTDGLTETEEPGGAQFGTERALDVVRRHHAEPARQIVSLLHRAAREFACGMPQQDDITIVVCRGNGAAGRP